MTRTITPILLTLLFTSCHGRTLPSPPVPKESLTFAFYNTENLWDPEDDPASHGDDDFTPEGSMRWTNDRLERKLAGIARAMRGMNDYHGPDLIGMCELENRHVLERLTREFLPPGEYDIAHAESPDERGIDVALLYRPAMATLKRLTMHRVDLGAGERPTRDIMEATFERKGRIFTVLVNHWPSRREGAAESEPKRKLVAATAARIIDSLVALDPAADIVMMGDLNDEPADGSVHDVLDARAYDGERDFSHRMINTAAPVAAMDTIGSYYYHNDWETIDQIILSRGLLNPAGLSLYETTETIYAPEFLRDARSDPVARPPYHTYIKSVKYIGGTSDHFPVFLRVGWGG
ncbi:MAG: putative extracellular nuclease [Chlorobi bacterium]|nr:putative extracellular nuclease [Chlorobiota bacterium]